jgi:hypothetical protein
MKRKTIGSRLISRPVATVESNLIWPAAPPEPVMRSGDAESDQIPGQRCPEAMAFRSWHPGERVATGAVIANADLSRDNSDSRLL